MGICELMPPLGLHELQHKDMPVESYDPFTSTPSLTGNYHVSEEVEMDNW